MRNKKQQNNTQHHITVTNTNDFRLVESYKSLRTNILFSLPAKTSGCRKVLLTSSNPGEGKTTTCVNIAISLSETKMRVLLIDADMRKPTVHKYFGLESRIGLSNALSGMNKLDECIQKAADVQNLWVVTSGLLPPNPSELLSSQNMTDMLLTLEQSFDFIVIDTPPINVVTDALALTKLVDGVIMVASQNSTRYPDVGRALSSLKFANANVLGFVLNRVRNDKAKYGRGYNYSYKYKYRSPYGTPSVQTMDEAGKSIK